MRFNEIITGEGLGEQVELKGSFCMENCGEGVNWKIGEEMITSSSVAEAMEKFREKVLRVVGGEESENKGDSGNRGEDSG